MSSEIRRPTRNPLKIRKVLGDSQTTVLNEKLIRSDLTD
jgi:hypothetical protein